jgi:hypothetical protein
MLEVGVMAGTRTDELRQHGERVLDPDELVDVVRSDAQMCCAGGLTAEEHRARTSDHRCCTDHPPTVDGPPRDSSGF